MKLKVTKREHKEVETELDLPVYLYFQDEVCDEELTMVCEEHKVTIKIDLNGFTISATRCPLIEEHHLKNVTTEEHFRDVFGLVMKHVAQMVYPEQT